MRASFRHAERRACGACVLSCHCGRVTSVTRRDQRTPAAPLSCMRLQNHRDPFSQILLSPLPLACAPLCAEAACACSNLHGLKRPAPAPSPSCVCTSRYSLKEAEGRAWTVRSNQRSSNTLYCRVNERMNNEMRRDSCSSSLINFVLNLSKLFLMNCRMSSS